VYNAKRESEVERLLYENALGRLQRERAEQSPRVSSNDGKWKRDFDKDELEALQLEETNLLLELEDLDREYRSRVGEKEILQSDIRKIAMEERLFLCRVFGVPRRAFKS